MPCIASWNLNSLRARLDHVRTWLGENDIDVLAVQETKVRNEDFPAAELADAGYHSLYVGQKSYNGVAVLSRRPQTLVATAIPGFDDNQARVLAVSLVECLLLNVYVPNGAVVGSEKYAYKLAWLDAFGEWLALLTERHPAVMVVGDFNIAPADADVHDVEAWRDQVLCSEAERARLKRLFDAGLVDVFRQFEQSPGSYSWWDYRAGSFRRNRGLRIDLILASEALSARISRCYIDPSPRGWDKPSDHAPVVACLSD